MAKKGIKSLEVGTVDNGISIELDDLLFHMKDKQGLFIRKGKYEILKGDLRQLNSVLFDVIMSEISRKLGSTRLSDTTFQDIQDRLSCVFESIDLDTYLNDIKVQEGYDLVLKLAPSVGLQYCKEINKMVLVESYEFCDISTVVLDYAMFCRDARELLQKNPEVFHELTENGIVEISKSGSKHVTSRGLEIKVFPKGMISLLRYNIAFSDIVLYDAKVAKYFATIIQDGKNIRVVSRIDLTMELRDFSMVDGVELGDFMKASLKGYGKCIELRNGSLESSTVIALRDMSCGGESFKDKYNLIHMNLETESRYERVMKFVDAVAKSISLECIGDVYVVGGSSLCGYSVLAGEDIDTLVIY